ncbi:sugar ABC transporter substrate-binding protein [Methylocystis bryophila]|uniref:Sugar ABC transporter substrate-binding protein n=1 Tax=Methylocystis bryophila TaxID=655015 RepID=A0A1W6MUJ3_9HYPH|nr:sugar ABC transporter substrate-binding protein [Methylocystis bryophila]BDV37195.1 sugar ABC transporter substrate-binding protein [Methylocystis bryophila]
MKPAHLLCCLAICVSIGLSGCEIFPTSGPANLEIRGGQRDPGSLPYGLVKVTPGVIEILAKETVKLSATFGDERPPKEIRFGIGDVVGVTLFEAGSGGLFIPSEAGVRPGNFVTFPNQSVDANGYITIPYAPPIQTKGRTPPEVQRSIVEALKNRAIEPQVIVTLVEQRTSMISVLGDVNSPARFPANAAGEHLLDAITRAGGPKSQGFDEWVTLERAGRRATVPFGAVVYEPANNIYVHPNDTIYIYREPQTFLAFGALGFGGQDSGAQKPFDAWHITLAEAVAKSGGLKNDLADPGAVFLYRGETRRVAEMLGVDCAAFDGPIIPVVYLVNFRDPAGFFFAKEFAMRNKDVIYVSNSLSVETAKAMTYFRLVVGTVNDPIVAAQNALIIKNLLNTTTSTVAAVAGGASASP